MHEYVGPLGIVKGTRTIDIDLDVDIDMESYAHPQHGLPILNLIESLDAE